MNAEDADIEINGMALSRGFVSYLLWLWMLSVVALGLWMFGVADDMVLLPSALIGAAILTVVQHRAHNTTRD